MEKALSSADVDAVVICLPHDLHVSFTCDSLNAGKHVPVEKPMALDEAQARQMVLAAEVSGRNMMVGQPGLRDAVGRQASAR